MDGFTVTVFAPWAQCLAFSAAFRCIKFASTKIFVIHVVLAEENVKLRVSIQNIMKSIIAGASIVLIVSKFAQKVPLSSRIPLKKQKNRFLRSMLQNEGL